MKENIFRKESIERLSSPEQLNSYIRICRPSEWVVIIAIIILLVGGMIWGIVGHFDTTINVAAVAKNGEVLVYIKDKDIELVKDKKMTIGENVYTITNQMCSTEPYVVDEGFSEYTLFVGNLMQGEWVYTVTVKADIQDGVYYAQIITNRVSPFYYIFN